MPRTTVNIDRVLLAEIKALAHRQGRTMGAIISELLWTGLRDDRPVRRPDFQWHSRDMGEPAVDINDGEALWLDGIRVVEPGRP